MTGMAFGVDRDASGSGLDALTLRRIIARRWNSTGITTGLTCTGRSDLKYNVAAGMAVCSMSAADGYTEAYWGGGTTENAVTAGDGTYARIDTVYMLSNTGSPDNLVHVNVQQGTPAATPVAPTLPAGALMLRQFRMPAGGSATSSALVVGDLNQAIPYGAGLGRIGYAENTGTVIQNWDNVWYPQATAKTIALPTERQVTIEFGYRAGVYSSNDVASSFRAKLIVDGVTVTDGNDECMVFHQWARLKTSWDISLGAGAHSITVSIQANTGSHQFRWEGLRYVAVIDRGVIR